MIRYAPIIADTIPAFTDTIKIPFTHNPAVSWSEVKGFSLIIKDMLGQSKGKIDSDTTFSTTTEIIFKPDYSTISLESGQYYKFQIAYVDSTDKLSPYSSVSIGRYIGSAPTFGIDNTSNITTEKYQGSYEHGIETLYQYRYDFYENNELIQTSDWILYKECIEPFVTMREIEINSDYKIKFSIITINGYEDSKECQISNENYPLIYNIELNLNQDYKALENGYVELEVVFDPEEESYGTYEILRKPVSSKNWELFLEFDYTENIKNKKHIWRDFTIVSSIEYVYGIRLKGENQFTDKIISDVFKPQFEQVFLSDGEKQLCVRFNPKVSNFKSTIAEQKTDTIGNKFPVFFRNPIQNYKEFSISGLLSYHTDNENFFMDVEDKVNYEYGTTNLTSDNFGLEKLFKLQVLDWLNNGKPKLFRSPAEGNYIVRLTGVSLTPNEQLGNMIHTFQASAVECMEMSQQNLKNNNMIFDNKIIRLEDNSEFNSVIIDNNFEGLSNISDIQYSNNTPSGLCELLVDGKSFKVYDYYKFPEETVYNSLVIKSGSPEGATIYYKQLPTIEQEKKSTFQNGYWEELKNSENITCSYGSGEMIKDWLKYYTIIFINSTESYQNISNNIILAPGETKKFHDLSKEYTFQLPSGVVAYVYGRKEKEVQVNE